MLALCQKVHCHSKAPHVTCLTEGPTLEHLRCCEQCLWLELALLLGKMEGQDHGEASELDFETHSVLFAFDQEASRRNVIVEVSGEMHGLDRLSHLFKRAT